MKIKQVFILTLSFSLALPLYAQPTVSVSNSKAKTKKRSEKDSKSPLKSKSKSERLSSQSSFRLPSSSSKSKLTSSPIKILNPQRKKKSLSFDQHVIQLKKQGYISNTDHPIQDHFSTYLSAFLPLGGGYWIYSKPKKAWVFTGIQLLGLAAWATGYGVQNALNTPSSSFQYLEHMGLMGMLSSWIASVLMWKTDPLVLVQPNLNQQRPFQLSLGYQWFFQNQLDLFKGEMSYLGSWINLKMHWAYQQRVNGLGLDAQVKLPLHWITKRSIFSLFFGTLARQWIWAAYQDELQTGQFILRPYGEWQLQFKSFAPSLKNTYFYQKIGWNRESFASTNSQETLLELYNQPFQFARSFMSFESGFHFDFSSLFRVNLSYIQDQAHIVSPLDLWGVKMIFTEENWSFDCQLYWGEESAVHCMYHIGFGG